MTAFDDRRRLRHPTDAAELGHWQSGARERLSGLLVLPDPPLGVLLSTASAGPRPQILPAALDTGREPIPCWLVSPADDRRNGAAVVAVAGHGRGIDALIDDDDPYHRGLALKLAAAGFTVLCPELRSFGRRRTGEAVARGPAASSCQVDGTVGLLTGRPVLGGRVADTLAAVRAAAELPGIDPDKVAVFGGSGGGAVALMSAALEPRIAAAGVGTYFSSFAASFCSVPHCICNSVPDLLTWFEMVDLAAMVAPRPLIIEAGENDPIFPVAATRAAHAVLVDLWVGAGAEPPQLIVTDRGHEFTAEEAVGRLAAALGRRTAEVVTD